MLEGLQISSNQLKLSEHDWIVIVLFYDGRKTFKHLNEILLLFELNAKWQLKIPRKINFLLTILHVQCSMFYVLSNIVITQTYNKKQSQ